jgi:phenylacetate-CoA ligase
MPPLKRQPAKREAELLIRLPANTRAALAALPRKSELPALHKAAPPLAGSFAQPSESFGRPLTSPRPIFDPEASCPWRGTRTLFADGFRPGDVVLNTSAIIWRPAGSFSTLPPARWAAVIPVGPCNRHQFELIEA